MTSKGNHLFRAASRFIQQIIHSLAVLMRQITGRDIVHDETQHGGLECVPSILNVWPLENIKGNGMLRSAI